MFVSAKSNDLARLFATENFRRQDSYLNSLPYYILTGRYSSRIYTNGETYIVTCQHPHKRNTTLIFPEIGGDGAASADLLAFLQSEKGRFQLARYTNQDLHKLKAALALNTNRDIAEIVDMAEDSLDWTYPVHILDTCKTARLKGRSFDKVRNKFNKAADLVTIERIAGHNSIRDMKAVLHFWVGSLLASGLEQAEERTTFYTSLFNNLNECPSLFDGFVVHDRDEPVGFTVWDKGLHNIANSLASISRRSIKGLSEFQVVSACRILDEEGVAYLNLGGSENAELNTHKLKFQPVHSIEINSYEIEFKENSARNFQVIKLV